MDAIIRFTHVLNGWLFFFWLVLMLIVIVWSITIGLYRLVYGRWPKYRRGVLDG